MMIERVVDNSGIENYRIAPNVRTRPELPQSDGLIRCAAPSLNSDLSIEHGDYEVRSHRAMSVWRPASVVVSQPLEIGRRCRRCLLLRRPSRSRRWLGVVWEVGRAVRFHGSGRHLLVRHALAKGAFRRKQRQYQNSPEDRLSEECRFHRDDLSIFRVYPEDLPVREPPQLLANAKTHTGSKSCPGF